MNSLRQRRRIGGQSVVEFAIVLPVILILLSSALDFGRLYFGYVAITNAAKEGALFGALRPNCDVLKAGCADPSNVQWRVTNELGGSAGGLTVTATCVGRANLDQCVEGDTYRVDVSASLPLITPIARFALGPQVDMTASTSAVVFNPGSLATIPTPTPTPTPTPVPSPTPTPTPGPCVKPTVAITSPASTIEIGNGGTVNFTGSSTPTSYTSLLWTFGDGATSTDSLSVSHAYTKTGPGNGVQFFDVTLTVRTGDISDVQCATTVTIRNLVKVQ